ncbi:hypothetical protein FB560_2852 [Microbacterium saperdae]|uniref:Uncharacterized protein n=2 Tax=Microbacterium saperdae TaxID=69368 RepID=A0A543BQS6_9MICO|nr:hypothetical protein FB560_2852 [Microbacterium saperdae]
MTSDARAREPLRSMSDAEKIDLAHAACDNLNAGRGQVPMLETVPDAGDDAIFADKNNVTLYAAGTFAYCNQHIKGTEALPEYGARLITYYRSIGEEAAKAEFADGSMPEKSLLGY